MILLMLCAGFATRLEPRTINTPKHLLPIGDKLLIDFFMDQVEKIESRLERKILLTNSRYFDQFAKWAKDKEHNIEVIDDGVKSKEEKLGAIGDLLFAIDKAEIDDDILIASPDYIYLGYDFNLMLDIHQEKKSSVNIVNQADEEMLREGSCLEIKDAKVLRFVEKPKELFSNWHGGPYYIIAKKDIDTVKNISKDKYDNVGSLGETLSAKGRLFAAEVEGDTLHLSSEDDYQKILKQYSK